MKRLLKANVILFFLLSFFLVAGCGEGADKKRPSLSPKKTSITTQTPEKSDTLVPVNPEETGACAIEHDLQVRFDPPEHFVEGSDIITFNGRGSTNKPIYLVLSRPVKVLNIVNEKTGEPITFEVLPVNGYGDMYYAISFSFQQGSFSKPKAKVNFFGKVYDEIESANNLRFVVGNFTTGIISPEGIYLNKGSGWYPDTWGSMAKYKIKMTSPSHFDMIAPGNMLERERTGTSTVTAYENLLESDGLDVVGGVYSVSSKSFDGITVEAFFHPDDEALAPAYLDAAATYIKKYSELLGPYPYNRFSIVSNFFPTGYGMPAFTLLGRQVIQRMHTQEYALGHEIVHNWWGNGVFVDWEKGNWCEGFTTYCANYYWLELQYGENSEQATEYRRKNLQRFKVFITPENDYPAINFTSKKEEKDNEIGYTKMMMFVHQLRKRVGSEVFFRALRTFFKEYLAKKASWQDIRKVFEEESGLKLDLFFNQWLERKGLPEVILDGSSFKESEGQHEITVDISQRGELWDVELDLVFEFPKGVYKHEQVSLNQQKQSFTFTFTEAPKSVLLDPNASLLRNIAPQEVRPCLNKTIWYKNELIVIYPTKADDPSGRFERLANRIKGIRNCTIIAADKFDGKNFKHKNILFIGDSKGVDKIFKGKNLFHIPPTDFIHRKLTSLTGEVNESPEGIAYLTSFDNPMGDSISIYSWFGEAPPAHLDRIIFFYGWNGYTIFKQGRKLSTGIFDAQLPSIKEKLCVVNQTLESTPVDLSDGMSVLEANAILANLTSEKLAGRLAGSEEGKKTAIYLANLLAEIGLSGGVGGDGYLQEFSFTVKGIDKIDSAWKDYANEETGFELSALAATKPSDGTVPLAFSGAGEVSSRPAFFLSHGINIEDLNLKAFDSEMQDSITGKICFICLDSEEELAITPENRFKYRDELSLYRRAKEALALGAAGVVFLATKERFLEHNSDLISYTNWYPETIKERYFSHSAENTPADDRLTISSLQSRWSHLGDELAAPVVVSFIDKLPVLKDNLFPDDFLASLTVSFSEEEITSYNVVGLIGGSDKLLRHNTIVLAAHYDHNGPCKAEGRFMPGANDNASGIIGLLATAIELKKLELKHDVVILFPGAEEWGMRGSKAYVSNQSTSIARTQAFLNFDMLGTSKNDSLYLVGVSNNRKLADIALRLGQELGLKIMTGIDHAIMGSDQWSFHKKGIPSLTLTSGRYREYNTPADTADILSLPLIFGASRLWVRLTQELDKLASLPKPTGSMAPLPAVTTSPNTEKTNAE